MFGNRSACRAMSPQPSFMSQTRTADWAFPHSERQLLGCNWTDTIRLSGRLTRLLWGQQRKENQEAIGLQRNYPRFKQGLWGILEEFHYRVDARALKEASSALGSQAWLVDGSRFFTGREHIINITKLRINAMPCPTRTKRGMEVATIAGQDVLNLKTSVIY